MDYNSLFIYLFSPFKGHSYGLVGYHINMRSHLEREEGTYTYDPHLPNSRHSMALTQCVFMHREYLRMFTERAPQAMTQTIDSWMNCEDIAMNMIASEFCQCSAVFKVKRGIFREQEMNKKTGLHFRSNHYQRRSDCLTSFAKYFTPFPLRHVRGNCSY